MPSRRSTPRGRSTQTFIPIVVNQSYVQKIYDNILATLESGVDLRTALEIYMPLLLNELDKMIMMYPYVGELFIIIVKRMWRRWFKDIPMPSLSEDDSTSTVMSKILATLNEHKSKIVTPGAYASLTEEEIEQKIEYTVLSFMHSVCSTVFSLLGVVF